ncbi:MAG: hypothetical protein CVV42_08850 [Candidatus Riflebacteria bacterium HGW-Riflebacteria-2]|jgi:hypothetical protein|nr:MAG: hypothetical protein CVV42_08850 [Candidatus Riflebacteria bacterium HGW-Riflebacteria-2]
MHSENSEFISDTNETRDKAQSGAADTVAYSLPVQPTHEYRATEEDLFYFRKWFNDYVATFASEDTLIQINIDLKRDHTLRVCRASQEIGHDLNLSQNDLRLAEIAALFHDIGRFEQFSRHRTFSDKRSFNHAAFGVGVLLKDNVLSRLGIYEQELIIKCISNHNKLILPDENDESVCLHSRLLRDADKLDIWWVVTDYYSQRATGNINPGLELDQPDTPGISPAVFESIMNGETVLFANLKNLNDFKLLQVGWVFDVNFAPTLRRLKERGYLDIIRSYLPASDEVEELFVCVNNYIEQRVNTA